MLFMHVNHTHQLHLIWVSVNHLLIVYNSSIMGQAFSQLSANCVYIMLLITFEHITEIPKWFRECSNTPYLEMNPIALYPRAWYTLYMYWIFTLSMKRQWLVSKLGSPFYDNSAQAQTLCTMPLFGYWEIGVTLWLLLLGKINSEANYTGDFKLLSVLAMLQFLRLVA